MSHLAQQPDAAAVDPAVELASLRLFRKEILKLASHDLRSPLALITGYASLISFDLPDDSALHDYVRSILQATDRMTGLADAILTVNQLLDPLMPRDEPVNLYHLTQTLLEDLDPNAREREHTLMLTGSADGALLPVNRAAIKEAIVQLLNNAMQYSDNGQVITVSVERVDDPAGARCALVVADHGWGIAPEQHQRMFDAFHRGKLPSGVRSEGRGLGLWIVRTAAERHGGGVTIASAPGAGSQIGFWLPV